MFYEKDNSMVSPREVGYSRYDSTSRKRVAGLEDGSVENLNFHLATVGKGREVGGRQVAGQDFAHTGDRDYEEREQKLGQRQRRLQEMRKGTELGWEGGQGGGASAPLRQDPAFASPHMEAAG